MKGEAGTQVSQLSGLCAGKHGAGFWSPQLHEKQNEK
jgi:hypothetical protein